MLQNRRNRYQKLIITAIILLSVFRIGLFVKMPYFIIGDSIYDDYNQISLSAFLAEGRWLGDYNYTTLIKGASYPLFVALSNVLAMPYPYMLGLYYVISVGLFCGVLYKIAGSQIFCAVSYILLLYSPAGFELEITGRLYRNAIIFPSVLLCLTAVLMVYLNRSLPVKKQLLWLMADGAAFLFFTYIREDSVWMLPLFLASLVICGVWVLWFSGCARKEKVVRCFILLIPVLVFLAGSSAYKGLNYYKYGVFTTNDRTDGPFAAMAGNMMKVEDEDEDKDYWISVKKLERIIDECPTLLQNKAEILTAIENWGNSKGDLTVWGLREAFNNLGYYKDARTIENVCRQVNSELLEAVKQGRLSFSNAIFFTKQCRGVLPGEIPGFIGETIKNIWKVGTFENSAAYLPASTGSEERIEFMQSVADVNMIHQQENPYIYRGWLLWKNNTAKTVEVSIVNKNTGEVSAVPLTAREDVRNAYPDYQHALDSGLTLNLPTNISDEYSLLITVDNKTKHEYKLGDYQDKDIQIHFDQHGEMNPNYEYKYSMRYQKVAQLIIDAERILSYFLLSVSVFILIAGWVLFCRHRNWYFFESAIIPTGVFLSVVVFEFGITVFDSWLDTIWFYSCGAFPMIQAFELLSLAYIYTRLFKRTKTDQITQSIEA